MGRLPHFLVLTLLTLLAISPFVATLSGAQQLSASLDTRAPSPGDACSSTFTNMVIIKTPSRRLLVCNGSTWVEKNMVDCSEVDTDSDGTLGPSPPSGACSGQGACIDGASLYVCNAGTWNAPSGGGEIGGYATIQDEGSPVTQRPTVNFIGSGVSCVDNSGSTRTDCTVTGGGGGDPTEGSSGAIQISDGVSGHADSTITGGSGLLTLPDVGTPAAPGAGARLFSTGGDLHIINSLGYVAELTNEGQPAAGDSDFSGSPDNEAGQVSFNESGYLFSDPDFSVSNGNSTNNDPETFVLNVPEVNTDNCDLHPGSIRCDSDADGTVDYMSIGDYDEDGSLEIVSDIMQALVDLCSPSDGAITCPVGGTTVPGLCIASGTAKRANLKGRVTDGVDNDADGSTDEEDEGTQWCGTLHIQDGVYKKSDHDSDGTDDWGMRIPWRGMNIIGDGGATIDIGELTCADTINSSSPATSTTTAAVFAWQLPTANLFDDDADGTTDENDELDNEAAGPVTMRGLRGVGFGTRPDNDPDALQPPWGLGGTPGSRVSCSGGQFNSNVSWSFVYFNRPDRVTLTDLVMHDWDRAGLIVPGARQMELRNIEVDGGGEHCISISRSGHVDASGLNLRNCGKLPSDSNLDVSGDGTADSIQFDDDNDGTYDATRFPGRGSCLVWFEGTSDYGPTSDKVNISLRNISCVDSYNGLQGENDGDGDAAQQIVIDGLYCDQQRNRCISFSPGSGGGSGMVGLTISNVVNVDTSWDGTTGTDGGGISVRTSGGAAAGQNDYVHMDNILLSGIDAMTLSDVDSDGTDEWASTGWINILGSEVRLTNFEVRDDRGRINVASVDTVVFDNFDRAEASNGKFVLTESANTANSVGMLVFNSLDSASDSPTVATVKNNTFIADSQNNVHAIRALEGASPADLDTLFVQGNRFLVSDYDGDGTTGGFQRVVDLRHTELAFFQDNLIRNDNISSAPGVHAIDDVGTLILQGNTFEMLGNNQKSLEIDDNGNQIIVIATGNAWDGGGNYVRNDNANALLYFANNFEKDPTSSITLANAYCISGTSTCVDPAAGSYIAGDIFDGGAIYDWDYDNNPDVEITTGDVQIAGSSACREDGLNCSGDADVNDDGDVDIVCDGTTCAFDVNDDGDDDLEIADSGSSAGVVAADDTLTLEGDNDGDLTGTVDIDLDGTCKFRVSTSGTDLDCDGTVDDVRSFGQLDLDADATLTTNTTDGDYEHMSGGTWAIGSGSHTAVNFDEPSNGWLRYTGPATRTFLCNLALSFTTATTSDDNEFLIGRDTDGTCDGTGAITSDVPMINRDIGSGGGAGDGQAATFAIIQLGNNDCVGLFVDTQAVAENVTVNSGSAISCVQID